MGAIPEHDPDEPVETKPFKFVTGMSAHSPSCENAVNIFRTRSQVSTPVSLSRIRPSTAGRTTSTTTSVSRPRVKTSALQAGTLTHTTIRPRQKLIDFQFYHAFRSLCPKAWTDRWDGQREAGNFPAHLDR
ncbi:uncharacterized protein N7477_008482 [Penicillium maclennaniae]|uniref:uncharacterized protein n=1 Tax=Penicillium maclennaniae TaxID=1343394 RepID=UPI0025421202|nr:uncharacterized protein N7477_008482 [Penicillium maclennaniae]KAJ5666034.1 hypothetical protein N7477_008482 [Penicillium maclennaniae]